MRLTPGLDLVNEYKPGRGWVAAEVRAKDDQPLALIAEAGYRATQDWSVFGDAWIQPTEGRYGADLGARWKQTVDLYVGGMGTAAGSWNINAGVKWSF